MGFKSLLPAFSQELEKLASPNYAAKVEKHHKSPDWNAFEKNLKRSGFRAAVITNPDSDAKLKRYTKAMGALSESKEVAGVVPSRSSPGKLHTIKTLKNGRLGCECKDWRYKHSHRGTDCEHIKELKQGLEKTSGIHVFFHGTSEEHLPVIQKEGLGSKRAKSWNMGHKDMAGEKKLRRSTDQRASVHLTPDPWYAATFGAHNSKGKVSGATPTVLAVVLDDSDLEKLRRKGPEGSLLLGAEHPFMADAFLFHGNIPPSKIRMLPKDKWPGWQKAWEEHVASSPHREAIMKVVSGATKEKTSSLARGAGIANIFDRAGSQYERGKAMKENVERLHRGEQLRAVPKKRIL